MLPYEQVVVLNINTGARFETYAIEGPPGRGDICLNGAAARLAQPGDLVIVLTYAQYDDAELEGFEPIVVHVDAQNRQVERVPRLRGRPRHVGGAMSTHLTADDIRARKGRVAPGHADGLRLPDRDGPRGRRRRHPARGRQPRRGRARVRHHPGGEPRDDGPPRPRRAQRGARHAHLRGSQRRDLPHARGGRRERAAARGRGSRLGQARGRAGAPGRGDRRRRHPGDRPRRAAAPDGRGLQARGHDPRGGRPHLRRGAGARRGRLLRDRDRGRPGGPRHAHHVRGVLPRRSASPPGPRPTARCSSPPT